MLASRALTRQLTSAVTANTRPGVAPAASRSLLTATPSGSFRQQNRQSSTKSSWAIKQANTSQTMPSIAPQDDDSHEIRPARPLFYHDQMEWLDERLVRISKPTKNVMQSGTASTNCWKIEFDSQPRTEYWLMGWTGTTDPVSNLSLTFPTKESAIKFCENNKLQWFVEEQPERKIRKKSYADNFSFNKRTRNDTK